MSARRAWEMVADQAYTMRSGRRVMAECWVGSNSTEVHRFDPLLPTRQTEEMELRLTLRLCWEGTQLGGHNYPG